MWAQRMGFIVALAIASSLVEGGQNRPPEPGAAWVAYGHPDPRFSFRHPKGLIAISRDPSSFHIEGLVAAVDLVDEPGSRIVLRFMVSEPIGNRMAVNYDRASLRKICKSYSEMKIGRRDAVSCVTCGRGPCNWTIHVLGRRQFHIMSFLPGEEGKSGPRDGAFPLLTIIQSLESY